MKFRADTHTHTRNCVDYVLILKTIFRGAISKELQFLFLV